MVFSVMNSKVPVISVHDIQLDPLYDRLRICGQLDILKYWPTLDATQKTVFLDQLRGLDLGRIVETQQIARAHHSTENPLTYAVPPEYVACSDLELRRQARTEGEEFLRASCVGALTVAGGQATRLGLKGPKGAFGVTPIKNKSLFEVFAQKIFAAQRRYNVTIPWVVMTSPINQESTRNFFVTHGFWGLREEDIFFMEQGQVPSTNYEGKFLLEAPNQLALNPDGHGGVFRALHLSGVGAALKKRGIQLLSYFQVDNPLVEVIDPSFIGLHNHYASEFSSKIVLKNKIDLYTRNQLRQISTSPG
ncbi:MAG: hypothetical protein B7Z71_10430 [Acidocella sp. 21-58-7]|nr:MAG: hypothetical protein B7Z71_10430 [Acidocella sp. 21-58-7]